MKVQSTFSERLARIESGSTFGGTDAYIKDNLVHAAKRKRLFHLDMLAAGGLAGGVVGTLFAMKVGLLYLVTLDVDTIYQLALADYTIGAILAGVAIAPVGFVMSQIFARSNPRGWQLWIGYLAGVIAANYADIQTYHLVLTAAPA